MVHCLQLQHRRWLSILSLAAIAVSGFSSDSVYAKPASRGEVASALKQAKKFYDSGQYFKAARFAFAVSSDDTKLQPNAYAWVTISLARAGLYQSASYFFVRTLQSKNKKAIRRVLRVSDDLLMNVGVDLFRKYLERHTKESDYDAENLGVYLYVSGKSALLKGKRSRAIKLLNRVNPKSSFKSHALLISGTAHAIQGNSKKAIREFKRCISLAGDFETKEGASADQIKRVGQERDDLKERCQAGVARTHYQAKNFIEAERQYDRISKDSFVWTDILFEQAWNGFAKGEYNRTLGKLVTYKSPGLNFVHNTEIEVLRAQAYLALCLYADANDAVNDFNDQYARLGARLKKFIESNRGNLYAFYREGKKALKDRLHTRNKVHRMMNRFVRSPYFQQLVKSEEMIAGEEDAIRIFNAQTPGASKSVKRGFPGFLRLVLKWRKKGVRLLGGVFVKNSVLDHYSKLIGDIEKIQFIKLEMLSRAKDKLVFGSSKGSGRSRGNRIPERRDDQYRWGFNGEFWNDEIGDYVFGLESECDS